MGRQLTALGVEGSANKVGVGVCRLDGAILSNPRTTYVPPRGHGFMPRETAEHHQRHVLGLIRRAMDEVSAAVSAGGRKEETLRATAQAAGQSCQPPGERESSRCPWQPLTKPRAYAFGRTLTPRGARSPHDAICLARGLVWPAHRQASRRRTST